MDVGPTRFPSPLSKGSTTPRINEIVHLEDELAALAQGVLLDFQSEIRLFEQFKRKAVLQTPTSGEQMVEEVVGSVYTSYTTHADQIYADLDGIYRMIVNKRLQPIEYESFKKELNAVRSLISEYKTQLESSFREQHVLYPDTSQRIMAQKEQVIDEWHRKVALIEGEILRHEEQVRDLREGGNVTFMMRGIVPEVIRSLTHIEKIEGDRETYDIPHQFVIDLNRAISYNGQSASKYFNQNPPQDLVGQKQLCQLFVRDLEKKGFSPREIERICGVSNQRTLASINEAILHLLQVDSDHRIFRNLPTVGGARHLILSEQKLLKSLHPFEFRLLDVDNIEKTLVILNVEVEVIALDNVRSTTEDVLVKVSSPKRSRQIS